jgi:hypothetical protein
MKITFTNSAQDFILETFDKTRDSDNFLVEKSNPHQRVLSQDGEEINLEHFAGVKKGSQIFIKSDLISLMRLCDDLA